MARPRAFDEQQALDAILDVFWRKGYDGTSIQDLVDASGVVRASLYGVWGDKDALFVAALDRYAQRVAESAGALEEAPSPLRWLQHLITVSVTSAFDPEGPRGCFVQQSGELCPPDRQQARQRIESTLEFTNRLIATSLDRAHAIGELPMGVSPQDEAVTITLMLRGAAAEARLGTPISRVLPAFDALWKRLGVS